MSEDQNSLLVVSADQDFRNGMKALLESEGHEVLLRESIERVIQLLELRPLQLIIIDSQLADGSGLDLIRLVRNEDNFYYETPLYLVGEGETDECISAFELFADDFSSKPLNRGIFLARMNKILAQRRRAKENPVTLEVNVESSEVPGIFQLLENEKKTGHLRLSCQKDNGFADFKEGKVVRVETEYCAGTDALTEILSWPFCQFRFTDRPIEDGKHAAISVSAALMDCVFEVDEYREILAKYSDNELSFVETAFSLPKESNKVAKKVHRMAVTGSTFEEIVNAIKVNRRHVVLLLDQLVENGYLEVAKAPFAGYWEAFKDYYGGRASEMNFYISSFSKDLDSVVYPMEVDLATVPFSGNTHWEEGQAAKLVIAGDDNALCMELFNRLQEIAVKASGSKPAIRSKARGEAKSLLEFRNFELEVQVLPQRIDHVILRDSVENNKNVFGLFYVASSSAKMMARQNRRSLKTIRNQYKGALTVIVPVENDEEPLFKMDCPYCSYLLSMDMDLAGSDGECPICATEVSIPNPIIAMKDALKLPEELPCVVLPLDEHEPVKNALFLMMSSVAESYQLELQL